MENPAIHNPSGHDPSGHDPSGHDPSRDNPSGDDQAVSERLAAERRRLEGLREDMAEAGGGRAESESASLAELSDADQHPADVGTETFNRERDLAVLEQIEAELADVEHALARLEAGTYGTCEACGRPIDDARLEAVPATRFCLEDERAAERGQ